VRNKKISDLIKDSIDFHVHVDPDPFHERSIDALALSYSASQIGMKAVVIKSHHIGTAPLAYLVNKVNPEFLTIGSLVLNSAVGGINPEVVEVAASLGAKVIWMPTYSSIPDLERRKNSKALIYSSKNAQDNGISIIDNKNQLISPLIKILEIVKEYEIVICTGHISIPEIYALVNETTKRKIKIVVTHPLTPIVGASLSLQQQVELVKKGAFIEHCFSACLPFLGNLDPNILVRHIKSVEAKNCILSTDSGLSIVPQPTEFFIYMLAIMLKLGLSKNELEWMVKINPAKLLDLT